MGTRHVPYYMTLGRGELTLRDIERAKKMISVGDPYKVDGYLKKVQGFVVEKHKHYFRVNVPGVFKSECIKYVDLLIKTQ